MSVSSPQISTLVKIMESLPASLQERVTDHLREYINDLQDEIKWDNSFAKRGSPKKERIRAEIKKHCNDG